MQTLEVLLLFIISSALGGLIGIQVERNENRLFLPGIRTHIIVATLGCLSYVLLETLHLNYLVYAIFASLILFILHENEVKKKKKKEFQNSFLYEILIIFSFINGILVASENMYLAVFLTMFISLILYFTPTLHNFSKHISKEEIHSTLFFICISAILLPILPNKAYILSEISYLQNILSQGMLELLQSITALNPYKIWFLVVVISGLSFCSYIAMKLLGEKKGLFLTSFLGGIVSSTALTSSFSISSKQNKNLSNLLAGGIILASSIMFVRVFIEILLLSPELASTMALPLLVTPIVGGILIYISSRQQSKDFNQELELKSPFEIKPALYFTGLFVLVLIISSISLYLFSEKGLYLTALLSGLVDVDAMTLTTAQLYANGQIEKLVAIITISTAVISNSLVKLGITYVIGSKELYKKTILYFLGLIITYILLLLVVLF